MSDPRRASFRESNGQQDPPSYAEQCLVLAIGAPLIIPYATRCGSVIGSRDAVPLGQKWSLALR